MTYHITAYAKESGEPIKVTVEFYPPGPSCGCDGMDYVTALGAGRNGRHNPYHPIEDSARSEAFERARQVAIGVFEAIHEVGSTPALMSVNQWLRRYPDRLSDLFDQRLVWIGEPDLPVTNVWITTQQAEELRIRKWTESKETWRLQRLQVGFCRDSSAGWEVETARLFVAAELLDLSKERATSDQPSSEWGDGVRSPR